MTAETDIDRLRQHLGGVQIDAMNGDNLAITLCTHFDNPDEEIEDETCWGPSALNGANATLDAIHAYYATALTDRDAQIERLTRERKDFAQTISEWATKAGEAEGRLKASEWPGVVEGWKDRATTAERDLAEARAEVERLRELFRADGEQHAQFVKNLTKAHEDRITKYADAFKEMRAEVDGWRDATMEAREGCRQRSEVISSLRRHLDAAEAEVKRKDVALRLAYGTLAQAFGRIHGLPRTSDTDLANAIGQTRAKIEAALRARITALEEEGKS